jgi:hypothetical protein
MTLPASQTNLALVSTPTTQPTEAKSAGWDPFEIWRTRVLLPRLAEVRDSKPAASPTKPIKLFP